MRQPDEAILVDMLLSARRIREKLVGVSHADFEEDENLQLAITYLIQIIGEAASRSDAELRSRYPQIPWWAQMIGMRNRIVHDYRRVRADIVWETAISDIPPLLDMLEAALGPEDPLSSIA